MKFKKMNIENFKKIEFEFYNELFSHKNEILKLSSKLE